MNTGKILLLLLPYWTPVVPPSGLSCLKGFLKQHGFGVKTVDANVEPGLREMYDRYFQALGSFIPRYRRGVLYNIGNEVWQNHMMAYLNKNNETAYRELVELLVYHTFYHRLQPGQISVLDRLTAETYQRLERYILDLLARERPTVLGISMYIGTAPASLFAFQLARRHYPDIATVLGGGIFNGLLCPGSPNLDYFLKRTADYIDKVIIGEGELLLLKLLRGELPESQRVFTLGDLGGELLDLSRAGVPDMTDFHLPYYPYLTGYTSRSCPFQCSFCSDPVFWGKFRKKNPAQAARELIETSRRCGSQLFIMSDLLMNPLAGELAEELLKFPDSVYWDTHFRVGKEVCDPHNTFLWRRGGLYRVQLGTESGSQEILDSMGKKITVQQIKESISALAAAGIKTTTYWVIGHPGETEADFQATLALVEELKSDIYQAEINPFWYVPNGQVQARQWGSRHKLLYPEYAGDMLMIRQWVLDLEPTREERYRRVNRFIHHTRELGIPNPYSLKEIHLADQRWKKLHGNAVPALAEFKEAGKTITENKHIKEPVTAARIQHHDDNWGF